jgi:putative ABC transport system permease protein
MSSWGRLFRRRKSDEELDEEVQSHLRMAAQERQAQGELAEQARVSAKREFGNVTLVKEVTRQMWGWRWLEQLLQDVRYGLRMLAKNPGFTAVAVLTLALGIGANTAIFSVVYEVLLRPLPYLHPDELVRLTEENQKEGVTNNGSSYVNYELWRKENHVFSELAGVQVHDLTLTGRGDPSNVHTVVVIPELFSLLGVKPIAGREFYSEDGKSGAAPVVMLSESLWRTRLGADPAIVGSSLTLDKRPFTVVGIMPASFRFPFLEPGENIWIPLVQDELFGSWMPKPGGHWLGVVGRLKPGVSIAQAQAEMDRIYSGIAREFPAANAGWTVRLVPLQQSLVGNVRPALLVLLGAVSLVLLIACLNIASLLLTRATSREKEMAVRVALGAGRIRIVRQLLVESAVLGLLGGIAGIILAYWGVRSLTAFLPPGLPQFHAIRVDGWMMGFAILLAGIAGLVSGLAPALFATSAELHAGAKLGGRTSTTRHERVRSVLVVAEIALAMVLLVGAGLLIRSFSALTSVSPGFTVQHILKAEISLPRHQYPKPEQWIAFSDELMSRIHAQPGLQDSAAAVPVPLADGFVNLNFGIVGGPPLEPGRTRAANYVSVTPDYFRVMGIPLLRGRIFLPDDVMSTPRIAVINQTLAHQYFPDHDPIGKQLTFGFPPDGNVSREVVGVVGDVRDEALSRDPRPMMYVPFNQAPFWGVVLVVKSPLDPASVAGAIRREVRNVDKDLPVTDVRTMTEVMDASVAEPRFRTVLLGLFGTLALVLAAVGIFGMISYSVARRTQEIGIRIALGAARVDVLKLVVGQGCRLALLGVGIGIVGSLALTRFLSSLLYGVTATDPLTFIAVSALLIAVAIFATYLPARRAAKLDPIVALRCE